MELTIGTRVLATIVAIDGTTSREMVRIVRILDAWSVLVTVESSLSTPASIRGFTTPIEVTAIIA